LILVLGDSMSGIAITLSDIALYRRYNGDVDGLQRSADRSAEFSDSAWRTIDDLRQRAFIVSAGRGSGVFDQRFEADLMGCMPDATVRGAFQEMLEADLRAASHPLDK
jgi:hypothetical protein